MSKKETAAEQTEAAVTDSSLSYKRRMALIVYLAILFIVALAIVTLSFVIQIKNNTQQYNTISEKAHALQLDNETLQKENAEQANEAVKLQAELDKLQTKYDALADDYDEQMTENAQLQEANDELTAQCVNILHAYDLLAAAKEAKEQNDAAAFEKAMAALEPIYSSLSAQAQEEYDALLDEGIKSTETETESASVTATAQP